MPEHPEHTEHPDHPAPAGALLSGLLDELAEESAELDGLVGGLDEAGWDTPTPAAGWTVRHQVAHLAWTDRVALLSATDPAGFAAELSRGMADAAEYVQRGVRDGAGLPTAELLTGWRAGRDALAIALGQVPEGSTLPWYGPPMSAASMVTARLMETWAHGQDVVDALAVHREPTARLRHVARLGVRTRRFSFIVHGLAAPDTEARVELTAPDGSRWTFGPEDAADRVTGPALDFCLLVTQRRHRADLDLHAAGPSAARWLEVAQAFAGPPGQGRTPGQFGHRQFGPNQ